MSETMYTLLENDRLTCETDLEEEVKALYGETVKVNKLTFSEETDGCCTILLNYIYNNINYLYIPNTKKLYVLGELFL